MRTVRTVGELRSEVGGARRAGRPVSLVPTMGALHGGHLALVLAARAERAPTDERTHGLVVVSLFVNPTQFDDAGDLAAYPRDEERDAALAAEAGADVLFVPDPAQVYPPGFGTEVRVGGTLTETLEGAARGAAHFHGVTTVVAKLLGMVQPDVACFGAKDAQQVRVISRMVADLDLPVRIRVVPTIRDADGLARSSRNARLDVDARFRAGEMPAALRAAAAALASGERDARRLEDVATDVLADADEIEYVRVVDPGGLQPVDVVERPALLVLAARFGGVRLIDNLLLDPARALGTPDEPSADPLADGLPPSAEPLTGGVVADPPRHSRSPDAPEA